MATQPLPPSRTASVGPPSAGGMGVPPGGAPGGGNSQQNLNQIVLEYLGKKGYSRTEAMLRKESINVHPDGNAEFQSFEDKTGGGRWYFAFKLLSDWVEQILDIYKPEMRRLLWPVFVHAFLDAITEGYYEDAQRFFKQYESNFKAEHEEQLAKIRPIALPEHIKQDRDLVRDFRDHKYRLALSKMAYATLIAFLEQESAQGGSLIHHIIINHIAIREVSREQQGGAKGLLKLMEDKRRGDENVPTEEEGIPGHYPGSHITNIESSALVALSLGPMPMEQDLAEDVKAELSNEDSMHPPQPGRSTLADQLQIKLEPGTEKQPNRADIPFPPSTARDVAMEVQKVKENRDRFKIEGRTGGVGPGVSVTMFTFHNTFDSVNCIEFSEDYTLAAIGTAESYIRVWSLENKALTSSHDPPGFQPSSSRRLIGHAGPVYALSFSPSAAVPGPATNGHTTHAGPADSQPRYMLSCSADGTIRLWSMETWTNLVVYKSHNSPVWDVRFCPHGHYFVSASADRTARLWSTSEIAPLRLFVGHDSDVETIAWHPNGAYVFTGSGVGDRTLRMWSLSTGTCTRIYTGHAGNITAIVCAPNGHIVASADDKGVIILWDLRSGKLIKRMRGHGPGGIWSLDWSVESTVLVSGGADNSVRVWDVQPNKESQNKANGEAGGTKIDGITVGGGSAVSKTGKAKGREQATADMISDYKTKKSPVYKVRFTQMNLVMAGGAYLP